MKCGRDSASTGMMMENLIITVIFIPGKYSCGSTVLDLGVAPIASAQRLIQGNRNGFQELRFHRKATAIWWFYKPLTGVILALMST